MAATKKAAKKVAAPRKRAAANKVFYAVIRRGIVSDRLISLFTTEPLARAEELRLENGSSWSFNSYTVQRVELIA